MDPEVQKLVDSGKISSATGAALDSLKPSTYCTHKSWGFGRVAEWNLLVNQITIDFQSKKGHQMQLQYAADTLTPVAEDHILVQKALNPQEVKARATSDPIGVVRQIIKNQGGKATADQISTILSGEVFNAAELKRWWENTRKLLKKDPLVVSPGKKTDPYTLRDQSVSQAEILLGPFLAARQLKDLLSTVDNILKNLEEFEEPVTQLEPVIRILEDSAQKNQRLHVAAAFELILARDEICSQVEGLNASESALTLPQMLMAEEARLPAVLASLPAAKLKRVVSELPTALEDRWIGRALSILQLGNYRVVTEIARLLAEAGKVTELRQFLDRGIRDHSISAETLYWLCKERQGTFGDLIQPDLLGAIVEALERDQHGEIRRGAKLHDLLIEDRELLTDILAAADRQRVRDAMRKLMLTPVFEELNKRSLFGRIIKKHPELESMLSGDHTEKPAAIPLIVSWSSLERMRKELEEIESKKIPENSREIGVARSYGDLRENFEFKAAKQQQEVLFRQRDELRYDIARARGTDFENPDTTQVSIGTVVKLRDLQTGGEVTYTILGAWDSEPEKHIINYLASLAQAMIGRKVGEIVTLSTDTAEHNYEIIDISAYNTTGAEAEHSTAH